MRSMNLRIAHYLAAALAILILLGVSALGQFSSAKEAPAFKSTAIATISLKELPPEAIHTLQLIRKGGPFPYKKDGVTFNNRERLLPRQPRGYYSEYTVKTPKSRDRGARRIVAGGDPTTSAEYYYTDDHYNSFKRITE
jgi:ribonuclease T1